MHALFGRENYIMDMMEAVQTAAKECMQMLLTGGILLENYNL